MRSAIAWEQYQTAREVLQRKIAEKLRRHMSSLVGNMESADILLVAADGKKLPAHECILRARAPGFYQRHVDATVAAMGPRQEGKMREVAIGDIDSAGLEFFIHSVYTEDEIAQFPTDQEEMDDRRDSSRSSNRSYGMEDSTELDFQQGGTDDRALNDETPTAGRPFLHQEFQSGNQSQYSQPRRHPMMHPSGHVNNQPIMVTQKQQPLYGDSPMNQSFPGSMQPSQNQQPAISASGYAVPHQQQHQPIYGYGQNQQCMSPGNPMQPQGTMSQSVPQMTSFRDIAANSPMNSSAYSVRSEVTDIPEEDEDSCTERRDRQEPGVSMSKFIRLDSIESSNDPVKEYHDRKRSSGGPKQIFPMFIGFSDVESNAGSDTMRGSRTMMAKRMSMTSLTSLTSIDLTPNDSAHGPPSDKTPCSKLAADLMQMYMNNEDTDAIIRCENGDIHAHKCILSATCPFFRQQLQKGKRIEMKGFTKNSVHFLLSFLYGGLTTIPDDVDVWEMISLATHLNLKELIEVVILHLKATKCHWFHRPCAACVSAVFDALPQFAQIRALKPLYDEALAWQARHFSRVWKGRVFLNLGEKWHKEAYEAVIQQMDDETLIDIILGCERLQSSLPRCKSESAVTVLALVDDVLEVAMQFLVHSFHLVVTSKAFQQQGKGLALNLGIIEDLFPTVIHSLSADVAIKSYKGLIELFQEIQRHPPSPKRSLSIPLDEYSTRFVSLTRRLWEITDKHLLHYAASVVKADAFSTLSDADQRRIHETGLFVELRQPKAPPPRLSSTNRSYKRSASAGVQFSQTYPGPRARSIDRVRPLSTIQPSVGGVDVPSNQNELVKSETTEALVVKQENEKVVESPRRSRKDTADSEKPTTKTDSKIARPEKKSLERPHSREKDQNMTSSPAKTKSRTNSPRQDEKVEVAKKSPAKKKAIETEEGRLERQSTHTIITMDKTRAEALPGPSPTKTIEKPKSVVKPMVKDPPLAAVSHRIPLRNTPKALTTNTREVKSAPSVRSSIPKSVTSSKPSSARTTTNSRTGQETTQSRRIPSQPTRTVKKTNTNNIEK